MTAAARLASLADAADGARYGGKAAGLTRLIHAGAPVPEGMAIAAAAFDEHLGRCGEAGGVRAACAALVALPDDAMAARAWRLREAIARAPLAPSVVSALQAAVDALPAGVACMVRSSALGEDGREASFAGQFDTVASDPSAAALETAVKQVWASAFNERALRYAQRRGSLPAGMGVVVQRRVDACASGVLFTRDPSDVGRDEMLLEHCDGPGERLVSGGVTPGRVRIGRGDLRIVVAAAPEDGSTIDPAAHPAVKALAALALEMERRLGGPQDIEWCIDRAGQLWLLQCRPMTAMRSAPLMELWSNSNIAENFPGPVTPFLASFVPRGYAAYFRGLGRAFGISTRRMAAMADAMDRLVGVQAGRLYYNLSNIHAVIHLAPGGAWLANAFDSFTGAEGAPSPRGVGAGRLERTFEALRIAVKVPAQYARVQSRVARFERRVDAYAEATRIDALAGQPAAALGDALQGFLDIRLHHWTDAALADTAAMVCYGALKALLDRWLPGRDHAQLHNDLLQGLPGLASAAPVEALWTLARQAHADPAALAVLGTEPAERVLAALARPECGAFRAALDGFLARWGFRYSGELMLTQPTPAEDPLPVIRLLQTYLRQTRSGPAEVTAERAASRVAATARVEHELGPLRAAVFRRVLAATQGAIRLRERARMKQALLYTRLRHVALALGERLAGAGSLRSRDDVFFLGIDEAIAAAAGRAVASGDIDARRAALEHASSLAPPDQFLLPRGEAWRPDIAANAAAAPRDGEALCGVGACGGAAEGRAAVLADAAAAGGLAAGTILVTRQTDPGWAAVFFLVRGLVVERGGMLSHGAIIAREYGIPAVVGVRDATRLIRDGDRLRVDGDAGRVEVQRA